MWTRSPHMIEDFTKHIREQLADSYLPIPQDADKLTSINYRNRYLASKMDISFPTNQLLLHHYGTVFCLFCEATQYNF